jgi:ABC-type spermidine/putrescine transport systems, ATPase components
VFRNPATAAEAEATGEVNRIPVAVRNGEAESAIGAWPVAEGTPDGPHIALVRPEHFLPAEAGEESDVIVAVEEASFRDGVWHVYAMLSGGIGLHVVLPAASSIHKGRLIALRYDSTRFRLVPREESDGRTEAMLPSVPSMRDTR